MGFEYSNLEKIRLQKMQDLRDRGQEPYPTRAGRTHTSQQAIRAFEAAEKSGQADPVPATLVGRIRSIRPMGKITFAHVEDGDGRIQLFFRANDLGQEQVDLFNREFDLGDFIQASGELFRTRTGEITLRVTSFRLLAKAITPLAAAKDEMEDGQVVRHPTLADPEARYRQRYADRAVNPEVRKIFRTRAGILRALSHSLRCQIGVAFQLTNILRDVSEDWQVGRLYLPVDDLTAFGLDEQDMAAQRVDERWRALMRFQIARNRQLYAEARPGIIFLDPSGRLAVATAASLYEGILSDIEAHDYDVFSRRAHVSDWEKINLFIRMYMKEIKLFRRGLPTATGSS